MTKQAGYMLQDFDRKWQSHLLPAIFINITQVQNIFYANETVVRSGLTKVWFGVVIYLNEVSRKNVEWLAKERFRIGDNRTRHTNSSRVYQLHARAPRSLLESEISVNYKWFRGYLQVLNPDEKYRANTNLNSWFCRMSFQ